MVQWMENGLYEDANPQQGATAAGSPKKGQRRPGLQQRAQALAAAELRKHKVPAEFEVGQVLQEADVQAKTLLKLSQDIQVHRKAACLQQSAALCRPVQYDTATSGAGALQTV